MLLIASNNSRGAQAVSDVVRELSTLPPERIAEVRDLVLSMSKQRPLTEYLPARHQARYRSAWSLMPPSIPANPNPQ